MKTKTIRLYSFEELSQKAKDKAREDFNRDIDYPFLQADLREYIHEELTEAGYTHKEITPLYSLSHSQGDGLMFEGSVTDKDGNTYTFKHQGNYYHERSTSISGTDKDGNDIDIDSWNESYYIPLCKRIAQRGYDCIEYIESDEAFSETCDSNDYLFLEDGTLSQDVEPDEEDITTMTLGSLLSHKNDAIKRNAIGILKQLNKK